MTVNINPDHLEAIKNLTLATAGIKNISPMDCRVISSSITEKTKLSVSETTIKRLFGFAVSKFNPSYFTLNAIAIYSGHKGWDDFRRSQPDPSTADKCANINLFNDPLISVLLETSTPTIILKANAPDFTIITYNKAYESATYTKKRKLKDLTIWQAFDPEKSGGYGGTLLSEALHDAIRKKQTVQMVPLHYNIPSTVPNITELNWWDIKIIPVSYDGAVKYLLLNTLNITSRVLHQDAIEQAIMKELTMAEDLATTNVKLTVALENLAESNGELSNAKKQLEEINLHLEEHVFERTKKLFESEAEQRELIDTAPVAIGILKGFDHMVTTANKKLIEYWGKGNDVINKPLAIAIPELEGQPFLEILDEVWKSGIPYINTELRALLNFNGDLQARYFDMIYKPIQHKPGTTDCIFIVAFDITEHVIARKKLEQSESMLRLAITAANIGIWSLDLKDRVLRYNPMYAEILGWDSSEAMTTEQALIQVTDPFRNKLSGVAETAIRTGEDYDITYAHKRFNDGQVIWLRATGKIAKDDSGEHHVFSGIVRELTNYNENL